MRLGQFLIPALDEGNYHGIEGEKALVDAGIKDEILFDVIDVKKPKFAYNYDFDLSFCDGYDFAVSQSLFTHLTLEDISKCFHAMIKVAKPQSQFFFTFFLGNKVENKSDVSHANKRWVYAFEDLQSLANAAGFDCTYIGDWGHERQQVIAKAIPKP